MSLPQPPEGVLDPKQPWWPGKVGEKTWMVLKAKLTGGEAFGTGYSSAVNLTNADADTLIENLKKDPRGYPQMDDGGGGMRQMENIIKYQEWLREEYLEKPFKKQVDAKIEEAAINSRMKEIEAERDQERIKALEKEERRKEAEIAAEEKELKEKTIEITEELDEISEEETDEIDEDPPEEEPPEEEPPEEEPPNENLKKIQDALTNIKASIGSQTSIIQTINNSNSGSVKTLGIIQDIFVAQTEILRKQQELKQISAIEASSEEGSDLSDTVSSTSTMGDEKAEAEVVQVDGDVLTIKPIDGTFKEGQRISTGGGGGFDLMGMIKGIASKFSGGGKGGGGAAGGGGSPLKMSKGGIALGPKKLANGGFQPGLYTKPTVGNLAPGQAVIPMNRNIGKKMLGGGSNDVKKKHQPLADVMQQPIKAIGGAIIAMAGNVIRSMGALAGFFTPYITPLIKSLGRILGVPVSLIETLLGGPAYAATLDLKKQTNIFGDLWSSLMETLGLDFGSKDDKKKKKKKKPNPTGQYVPIDWKKDPEFGTAVNRVAEHFSIDASDLMGLMASESGLNPASDNKAGHVGLIQFSADSAAAVGTTQNALKKMSRAEQMPYVQAYLEKWKLPKGASAGQLYTAVFLPAFIGKPDDFVVANKDGTQPAGYPESKRWYSANKGLDMNKDGKLTIRELGERIQEKKREYKISAESGVNVSQGKPVDAYTLTGPTSGYDVEGIGQLHGEEAVLEYEKGLTILPIENNKYSLKNNPLDTILRWKELLSPSMNSTGSSSYASGGKVALYAGHADMTSDSSDGHGTNGGPTGGAPLMSAASGYFSNEAYLNDKIAAATASKSKGVAVYRSPTRTKNGSDPSSNWARAKNDASGGRIPIEIHHDAESGKAGLITKDQKITSSNKFLKSVNSSFGFYRTGNEGFLKRGGAILEMDALKPHMRANPSAWISSASTKLANSLIAADNGENPPSADNNSSDPTNPAEDSVEEKPLNMFEAMEKSIKDMAVGIGLAAAVGSGEVTDEKSYKAFKDKLISVTADSPASSSSNVATPAPVKHPPNVQVVGSGGKQIITISGMGGKRTSVGVLEDNLCRRFG